MTASRSKWLVGSSSNKISGSQKRIFAKAILILHPPDSFKLGLFWTSLEKPNLSNKIEAFETDSTEPISYSLFYTLANSSTSPFFIN